MAFPPFAAFGAGSIPTGGAATSGPISSTAGFGPVTINAAGGNGGSKALNPSLIGFAAVAVAGIFFLLRKRG